MKLSVTQSATTKRIQELERHAASPLFTRRGTRLVLTEQGGNLLTEAEGLLQAMSMLAELRKESNRLARTLRIGITELTALTWFPLFARRMKSAYPGLRLHPEVDLSAVLHGKVVTGALDVVVVQELYLTGGLASIPVQSVQYGWFCKPGLVAPERGISLHQIAKYPIIEQTPGSGLTALTRQIFNELGIDVEHVYGSNSLAALGGLVEAGFGVACLPVRYFRSAVRQGRMTHLQTVPVGPKATYHLAFLPGDQATLHAEVAGTARRCAGRGA